MAEHEGSTFVDMGDETGRCVKINSQGWTIEGASPALFRRTRLVAPLVEPVRGVSLAGFFDLLNLPPDRGRVVSILASWSRFTSQIFRTRCRT